MLSANAVLISMMLFMVGYVAGYASGKSVGMKEYGWHEYCTDFENSISMIKLLMLYGYPVDDIRKAFGGEIREDTKNL